MMHSLRIALGILPPPMEIFKVFGPYLAINFETLRLEKTPIRGIFACWIWIPHRPRCAREIT
jgi:hypothetical protein